MRSSGNEDKPYEVTVSMKCAEEIFRIFTEDPHSIEKCLYNSFKVAGDTGSNNVSLESDFQKIKKDFVEESLTNPSLLIDGKPYR